MRKNISYIFTLLLIGLLISSCSKDQVEQHQAKDKNIALRLMVQNYKGTELRSGFHSDALESQITNLYIIIFADQVYTYDITETTVTGHNGGTWNKEDGEILLGLTQDLVGEDCDVYVFANVDDAEIKDELEGVNNPDGLESIFIGNDNPWSNNFSTSLLMSGYKKNHNFITDPVLDKIEMERAVAKLQIEVELTEQYQSTTDDDYKYRLRNFDKNSYLIQQEGKTNDLISQTAFADIGGIIEFVKEGTVVTGLKLTTYLNERDIAANDNIALDLILPFWDEGAPPPSFTDDDIYSIVIDKEIKRNHFYTYKVKM